MESQLLRGTNSNVSPNNVKKRRQRFPKSCAFCRRRKLKCDRKRPVCRSCQLRDHQYCDYSGSDDHMSKNGIITAMKENSDLKGASHHSQDNPGQMAQYDTQVPESENSGKKETNRSRLLYHVQHKDNGRTIIYGVTSSQMFFAKMSWGMNENFQQLWKKVKADRHKLKQRTGRSLLWENRLLTDSFDGISTIPTDMAKQVCNSLPSYETIERMITYFFENSQIFEINGILDRAKVMKDSKSGFVPGEKSPGTLERPVIKLIPSTKDNYYRVGVILGVLQLSYYKKSVSPNVGRFLVFLTGLSTAKVMYIERVQMLCLRFFYRLTYDSMFDSSHTMILASLMIQDAMKMGLNRKIPVLLDKQESTVGSIASIENLWCWILIADWDIAFYMGSPLQITEDHVLDEDYFVDDPNSANGLLKRFLKLGRSMQIELFKKDSKPALNYFCEQIMDFLEVELPPIWYLSEGRHVRDIDAIKKRVICYLLTMFLAFNGLLLLQHDEDSQKLENAVLNAALISFAVCINMMKNSCEKDEELFSESLKMQYDDVGPYLTQSLSISTRLFSRSLLMFYGLGYHKLTLFESNTVTTIIDGENSSCNLKTLRVQPSTRISIIASLESFCKMFDDLLNDSNLKKVLLKSHILTIVFSMERIGRTIIENVLKYRNDTEKNWFDRKRKRSDSGPFNRYISDVEKNGRPPNSSIQEDMPNSVSPGEQNNITMSGTLINEKGSSVLDGDELLISEDFWTSYNVGWEEFLNGIDSNELLADFMLDDQLNEQIQKGS